MTTFAPAAHRALAIPRPIPEDAPVITSGTQSGAATEDADGAPGENTDIHSASGAVTFTDVDTADTHTATATPAAGGYLGTFVLDTSNIDTGNGGSVGWTFTVSDGALDFLSQGQTLTQTYTVEVDDNHDRVGLGQRLT